MMSDALKPLPRAVSPSPGHVAVPYKRRQISPPITLLHRSENEVKKFSLSFAGCGFLGIYHIGVSAAFRQYAPPASIGQICGASAGALAAASLLCNSELGQATSDVLKVVQQARSRALGALHPNFNMIKILREGLNNNLPSNAHQLATGRVRISLTRFSDGENVVVDQFDSRAELIQV